MLIVESKEGLNTLFDNSLINDHMYTVINGVMNNLNIDNICSDTPFVILQDGDDIINDFSKFNLPSSVQGLYNKHLVAGNTESIWEFVNTYTFNGDECNPNEYTIYELLVCISNEYMVTVFIPDEKWLDTNFKLELDKANLK